MFSEKSRLLIFIFICQGNNKNELQRLDKEKQHDFLNMLRGFIVNQAGYAEKTANVWEEVAQETSTYVKT
ncbi:hypothetical protein LIER_35662 [Lithospermum erythrorhizon]|uniref:Uncharacterized protein n=1 Tax=Lithospermum erythrorhizon TaxID=34254 RepID=A0AAV3NVS0_LITER